MQSSIYSLFKLAATAGVIALAVGCQNTQNTTAVVEPTAVAAPIGTPIPNSPSIITGQFENGMGYVIRKNAKPENRVELRLLVKAGSLIEEESQRGFAHFAEHMAFNGTEDFSKNELVDYIESVGMKFGQGLNAYTSSQETVYKLTVPTDDPEVFENGFKILENWAHKISFEPEEIDKERGVIIEEWRRKDSANWRLYLEHLPTYAKGTRFVDRVTIGLPEIIENGTHADLIRYYKKWYQPQNMVVFAVGDFEPDQVKTLMQKYLASIQPVNDILTPERLQIPDHKEPLVSIATDPEVTHTSFQLVIDEKEAPTTTFEQITEELKRSFFSRLLSARVSELIAKGKLPASQARAGFGSAMGERQAFRIWANVEKGKMQTAMNSLLSEVYRVAQHGFTAKEFERQISSVRKSAEKMISEADKTRSSSLVRRYLKSVLANGPLVDSDAIGKYMLDTIDSIELADINALAADWINRKENRSIIISAPDAEKATLPTGDEVQNIWQLASQKSYQPYLSTEVPAQLMTTLPPKGSIVERSYEEKYNAHVWRLSNGAKVVLKPTDFKNDEILFHATSWGGMSMVDDATYKKTAIADSLLDYMGVADINAVTMQKFYADKKIRLRTNIADIKEKLDGYSSIKDLTHFMQLLHLKFTAPRKDANDFNLIKARYYTYTEKQFNDPMARFYEQVNSVVNNNNPRYISKIDPQSFQQQDLDASYQHFKQRFANAGDFAFVFVGNLDLVAMEELVTTYLASLPSKPSEKEQWQAHADRRAKGHFEFHQKDGLNQKAHVQMDISGEAVWSEENKLVFRAMTNALKVQLRKKIREELGGTYGVGVSGSFIKEPRQEYLVRIRFSCNPERVDELSTAIRAELADILANGVPTELVENFIKQQLKSRESSVKLNKFWVKPLAELGDKPVFIVDDEKFNLALKSVTVEAVNDAMQRYLNAPNSLYATLLPKDSKVELTSVGKKSAISLD